MLPCAKIMQIDKKNYLQFVKLKSILEMHFFTILEKKLKRPHFAWLTDTGESNFQVSLQFTVAFINWYFNIIAIFSAFKWLVWYVVWYVVSGMLTCYPCVKSVRIQSYSGPYFLAFEVNTEWDTSYLFVFSANAGKCGPE